MIQQKTKSLQHTLMPAAELHVHQLHNAANNFGTKHQAELPEEKDSNTQFEELLLNVKRLNKVILFNGHAYEFVKIASIIRCESVKNYTIFYLEGERTIVVSKTLKEFDDLLTHFDFVRTHKSHLINIHHILKFYRSGGGEVEMADGKKVPVSDTYKEVFLSLLPV